jgi:hypothetical protein
MMVITPKNVGAVLMSILTSILKLFLRQFTCTSDGEKTLKIYFVLIEEAEYEK